MGRVQTDTNPCVKQYLRSDYRWEIKAGLGGSSGPVTNEVCEETARDTEKSIARVEAVVDKQRGARNEQIRNRKW